MARTQTKEELMRLLASEKRNTERLAEDVRLLRQHATPAGTLSLSQVMDALYAIGGGTAYMLATVGDDALFAECTQRKSKMPAQTDVEGLVASIVRENPGDLVALALECARQMKPSHLTALVDTITEEHGLEAPEPTSRALAHAQAAVEAASPSDLEYHVTQFVREISNGR